MNMCKNEKLSASSEDLLLYFFVCLKLGKK